jgi:hypothetical protein
MNKLKVYILPSIKGKLAFHARFLRPNSRFELGALFAVYILRKWRFQISDSFGQQFHKLAISKYEFVRKLHFHTLALTTRKAVDEYFFRQIPTKTDSIEFILPLSVSLSDAEKQLKYWLLESPKYAPRLILLGLLLPTNIFVAKYIGFVPANILLSYHLFRFNQYFRAYYGSTRLQTLINRNKVEWKPSVEFSESILVTASKVSEDLKAEGIDWKWEPGHDLNDEVVEILSKEHKIPELLQTVRRSRMQYYVKGSDN